MAFWGTQTLRRRLPLEKLVEPYYEERVKHGAYELALGPEAYITSSSEQKKKKIDVGDQVVIPPGQFGLLLTEEKVSIPRDAIGLISIKASVKFRGLVNVSGFHVDPGFTGRLKFSVYNAGSQNILLSRHQAVFLIWFSTLDEPTDYPYDGNHQNQNEITSEDVMQIEGDISSPGALKKQMEEMRTLHEQRFTGIEKDISLWRSVTVGLLVSIVVLFGKALLDTWWHSSNPPVEAERLQASGALEKKKPLTPCPSL